MAADDIGDEPLRRFKWKVLELGIGAREWRNGFGCDRGYVRGDEKWRLAEAFS